MTTLVSSIILDALRETNLTPLGVNPTTDQSNEAFRRLSTIVASVLGNEAGENMTPMPLGQNTIGSPSGYPWWGNQLPGNAFVPINTRIMCNLTAPATVNLPPSPHDGARMGIVDVSGNFATNSLTIKGNGRNIEGSASKVYNTNSQIREWVYREDLGNWVTVLPLDALGSMPFPTEFDDMFIIMLAGRLNPRYGQSMHPASVEALQTSMSKFSARYKQYDTEQPSELGLTRTNSTRNSRNSGLFGDPTSLFNSGFPF